jgi:NitT/TauT family transport system ATP-binding protein
MRLKCLDVGVDFSSDGGSVRALESVSLETADGEFVSIVGPSGCGKTTLLRAIVGLLPVRKGSIEHIVCRADQNQRILTVFQENSLFPWMTALDNAAFGLRMQGIGQREREEKARELLWRFGFRDREDAYPYQLSLGMKQRVAVIRCFLSDPALMLMDEPFAALDALTRLTLQEELLGLWERDKKSVLFVTHDLDEAIRLSDRILVMSPGPAQIIAEHRVPFPRPRPLALITESEFQLLKAKMHRELGLEMGERTDVR